MQPSGTTQGTRWKIAASARSSSDRDGCVLLDMERGVFYGANPLGSRIWEWIREKPSGITFESLVDLVAADDVEVPRDQISRDLDEYLQRLAGEGLLIRESFDSSAV